MQPSSHSFLNGVYEVVFHRPIDAAGVSYFGTLLAQNGSRYQTALAILTSFDAFSVEINNDFQTALGRNADAAGINFFVTELTSGTREEAVFASILASPEFANKLIPAYDATKDFKWLNQVYEDLLQRGLDGPAAASSRPKSFKACSVPPSCRRSPAATSISLTTLTLSLRGFYSARRKLGRYHTRGPIRTARWDLGAGRIRNFWLR